MIERTGTVGTVAPGRRAFGTRVVGAARLVSAVYEEVEADRSATPQAALVVCLAAASVAIGHSNAGLAAVSYAILRLLIGWLFWSGITYVIGWLLLRGKATLGELLRTIGFAHGPLMLSGIAIYAPIASPVRYLVGTWMVAAVIVAIRQALDFDEGRWGTAKAMVTAGLGFIAYVGLALLGAALLGIPVSLQ
jgi:hypothetical protein